MLPLSPALFIAAANAWLKDDKPFPELDDNELDAFKRDDHRPRDPVQTAAFIGRVGYWAHHQAPGVSTWPFPLGADCTELWRIADKRRVVLDRRPDPGAILLRWSTLEQRFTRASIVIRADDSLLFGNWTYDCAVIEGIATPAKRSRPELPEAKVHWVRRARRRCCPMLGDRFVSWVDLDMRGRTGWAA